MNKKSFLFIFVAFVFCFLTSQAKIDPNDYCEMHQTCNGSCAENNIEGKCGVYNLDYEPGYAICGCLYCRFDNSKGTCNGVCEASRQSLNKCISRVQNPKQDSDCTCTACKMIKDQITGNSTCTGLCGNGRKCRFAVTKATDYFTHKRIRACQCVL